MTPQDQIDHELACAKMRELLSRPGIKLARLHILVDGKMRCLGTATDPTPHDCAIMSAAIMAEHDRLMAFLGDLPCE